ncbi:MAG: cation transporter [Clostridiales bacterium]|nr:cation transporter [Clostridiales bacterium]
MVKTYKVVDLDCANCAAKLERALSKIDGVNKATVNFFAQKITLDIADDKFDGVIADVRKTCKKVEPDMQIKLD